MAQSRVTQLDPAPSGPSGRPTLRELHSRTNHGIQVDLLWCERKRRALVAVTDTKSGAAFSVPVGDDERALDVFHHPYAYAASRGVDTSAPAAQVNANTVSPA
jgi:hypothetical protein